MTALAKGASAAALTGTAATGGIYFGTDLFKNENKTAISSLIKNTNPEKRLITSKGVGDDVWKKAYKAYREANKDNEKDIWGLKDWTKPNDPIVETNATEEFISKCDSNSKAEVSNKDDLLYKQVLAYCTRDTLVSDLISEGNTGKKLLDKNVSGSDQDSGWQEAWKVYRTQNSSKGAGQDPWGLESWDTKKDKDELPNNYKDKCVEHANKPAHQLDDENYRNVLSWCTK
ncbi:hypothetical protein HF1_03080 [Mycoplasma haemofelis str. Langford 1]|uniref:Uncharacterized protein n=1 Tax=Mycoplasma haemofelis (strain Langford 1) TaxID=941640 RepID=E8ZGP5_MYCHL|nr:hypothetical protein [Mycoplasma haemofelis]CBY92316.1 hypothetical protein HF1_03080 [Mycoplasma haemofelis str. Langford 1]